MPATAPQPPQCSLIEIVRKEAKLGCRRPGPDRPEAWYRPGRPEAVADLERRSKKIKTYEEIAQVGSIAANGEKMIGEKIAEAMRKKIGNEGVITVEKSKALDFELETVEGMQFDRATSRSTSSPMPTR